MMAFLVALNTTALVVGFVIQLRRNMDSRIRLFVLAERVARLEALAANKVAP